MKRSTEILVVTLFLLACLTGCATSGPMTRVLFIGNSYTMVNDLPGTFAALAKSGGHAVEVDMAAQGGWFLYQHAASADTLDAIASKKWDYVVLQEQSQTPSVASRAEIMYPAARTLVQKIQADGATPVFFLTWAHQNGWPEQGLPDYESMQLQLNQGILAIAHESNSPVAPVGYAWLTVSKQSPQIALWQADGSHPSMAGTYLAACVFYATLFHQTPEKLSYHASLTGEAAAYLQTIAAHTVLDIPSSWNLH
jgi:hypothetical protein